MKIVDFESPSTAKSFPSGYTAKQAARLLELSENQIRGFIQEEFIEPRRGPKGELRLSFQDLVLLRTAKELSKTLSTQKIKRVLRDLKEELPQGRDLSALRITAEGDEIVVRDGRTLFNPESGQTLMNFAVADLAAEVAPLAVVQVEEAKENDADMVADDWYEIGCDLETHEPDHAREAYRRALELEPMHPDAHINLGRLLHLHGHIDAAQTHYRLALQSRPKDATAAYNLGVALQDLGRVLEAMRAYRRAIHLDPMASDAHYNLAQICEETGRKREALRHLQAYKRLAGEESA
ncbi:MAG: tetratricopeptide repeat protein [Candidatus Eisenbacteria bacterium]|uniref:Tetratricopeptide repeat protein n=1 Tax=Eiseniibacteriota bacterium TaxID=2212470 RepID=A0A7Y2H0S8_UNCEI|nr:tetratricopeptide repeat protein [Candidatus Eisenbacteria bacterium]